MQSVHKGITSHIRSEVQRAGLKIEEADAQKAVLRYPGGGAFNLIIGSLIEHATGEARFDIMKDWESTHEGIPPFSPGFVDKLWSYLHGEAMDKDPADALTEITKMCEEERMS